MSNDLVTIQNYVLESRRQFEAVCVDRSLNFEREASFATQALMANEYTLGVAKRNPQSVINAVANIAAIGLSLNPAKRQAYLVPRDGRICLDIGYIGLLDLAIESGSIRWGQAELVHAADKFTLNGVDKPPTHERDPFLADRGDVIGAYVVVKTCDGDYLTTTMPVAELLAIRDRSSAWKNGQKGPWKTDPGEMMKKTVIKRAYKLWPKTERLSNAIHHLNTENEEGIDLEAELIDRPKNITTERDPFSSFTPQAAKTIRAVAAAAIQSFSEGNDWAAFEEVLGCVDKIGGEDNQMRNDVMSALAVIFKPHSALRGYLKEQFQKMHANDKQAAAA